MGIAIRQASAADGTVAMADIERRAQDLHAAGEQGRHGKLQVQAAMDFLLGRAAPASAQAARRGARCDARRQDGLRDEPADQDHHAHHLPAEDPPVGSRQLTTISPP